MLFRANQSQFAGAWVEAMLSPAFGFDASAAIYALWLFAYACCERSCVCVKERSNSISP